MVIVDMAKQKIARLYKKSKKDNNLEYFFNYIFSSNFSVIKNYW